MDKACEEEGLKEVDQKMVTLFFFFFGGEMNFLVFAS